MLSSGGRKIYAMNMGKYESYIRDKEFHILIYRFTRIVVPFPIEFFFCVLGRTLSYDLELCGKMHYLSGHETGGMVLWSAIVLYVERFGCFERQSGLYSGVGAVDNLWIVLVV